MFDAQQRQNLIDEILNEAVTEWVDAHKRHDIFCDVYTTEDNELCLVYEGTLKKGYGSFLLHFKPRSAVEKLLDDCERCCNEFKINFTDTGNTLRLGEYEWQDGDRERMIRSITWLATEALITNLMVEMSQMMGRNYDNSLAIANAMLANKLVAFCKKNGIKSNMSDNRKRGEKDVAGELANKLLKMLVSSAPNWAELSMHTEFLEKVWGDARDTYRKVRSLSTWIEVIQKEFASKYKDLHLPTDLVQRLSGRRKLLAENAAARLAKRASISQPKDIALEHAARLCGADDYQFDLSYLYRKLKGVK